MRIRSPASGRTVSSSSNSKMSVSVRMPAAVFSNVGKRTNSTGICCANGVVSQGRGPGRLKSSGDRSSEAKASSSNTVTSASAFARFATILGLTHLAYHPASDDA